MSKILDKKSMRLIVGYIGEKCALQYLKDLGFATSVARRGKRKGRFDNFPYYRGDLTIRKNLYPNVVSITPESAFNVKTGEFFGEQVKSITYDSPFWKYKYVEVKASFGQFPRLSGVLTPTQRKRKRKPFYLLVNIKEVTPDGISYEIKEVPNNWASRESLNPWKNQEPRPFYPTKKQLKKFMEKIGLICVTSSLF